MSLPATDLDARVYTPQRVAALLSTLAEDGVPAHQALEGSGLSDGALTDPATRVSCRQLAVVFRNAARLAHDPATALRAGARTRVTDLGIYGYALLSSPTAVAAHELAAHFHLLASPGVTQQFIPDDGRPVQRLSVSLTPDPTDALARFVMDFTFTAELALARALHGPAYRFAAVHAVFPAPDHEAAYTALLECPVSFEQAANELVLDGPWLARSPRQADAITHAQAREFCRQQLREMTQTTGSAGRVRHTLLEQMPWRFARLEQMAEALSIEPRTLRRRLKAQGTSYRELLAEARCTLAIDYLRHTRMTHEEIASRLGYSDASNFRHAFAGWTGRSPQAYRKERSGA